MPEINSPGTMDLPGSPFPTLESLKTAHNSLLRRRRFSDNAPEFLEEVRKFIEQCRLTGVLLEADAERSTAQTLLNYWSNALYRFDKAPPDALLAEFDPIQAPILGESDCPYLGLDAFQEKDQGRFFGRKRLLEELLSRLQIHRLLAVVGISGSGKSSLVRGGLLPALRAGGVLDSQTWRYFPPIVPGSTPLANLARVFQPQGKDESDWLPHQGQNLQQDPGQLARLFGVLSDKPVVLVIDQFEEVFTLCEDKAHRRAFIENLMGFVQAPGPRHTLILTMRSDFVTDLEGMKTFRTLFEQGQVNVTPLDAGELREAIEKPAHQVGLKFEDGVVEALLRDIVGEPAALPLLQYTLLKLWQHRERNRVTKAAYDRLGGGRRALAKSADDFFKNLIPEDQTTARRLLLRMARPGPGLEVTSNRVRREEFYRAGEARERIDGVLDNLVHARLVRLTRGGTAADDQVEVAHEALLRNWPRLEKWLADERRDMDWRHTRKVIASLAVCLLVVACLAVLALLNAIDAHKAEQQAKANADKAHAAEERANEANNKLRDLTNDLQKENRIAIFHQLVTQALNSEPARVGLAARISMEAFHIKHTVESRSSLLDVLEKNPPLITSWHNMPAPVTGVAISPDGKTLASCDREGRVILWEVTTGKQLNLLEGPRNSTATGLAFSPDGLTLASGGEDKTVRFWEVRTGKPGHSIALKDKVRVVAFNPKGRELAAGLIDGAIHLLDRETGEARDQLLRGHKKGVIGLAFSSDGRTLVSGGEDDIICLWEVTTGKSLYEKKLQGGVRSFAINPRGRELAAGLENGTVLLWDKETGEQLAELHGPKDLTCLAFSPDGRTLASANGKDEATAILLWDVGWKQEVRQPLKGHTVSVSALTFGPDGRTLASGGGESPGEAGTVCLWDVKAHQAFHPVGEPRAVSSVVVSGDGEMVASGGKDGSIYLWKTMSGEPLGSPLLGHKNAVTSVAFSPNGHLLASGGEDGEVRLWDVAKGQASGAAFQGHQERVRSLAFTPDGRMLASAGDDNLVILRDMADGQSFVLHGHSGRVTSLAVSGDGKILASGGFDSVIYLWDVVTHQATGPPLSNISTTKVTSVAFSPDGTKLASGDVNGTICLWDTALRQPLRFPITGQRGAVTGLAFTAEDGTTLASGGADGSVCLWDVTARRRVGPRLVWDKNEVNSLIFAKGNMLVSSSTGGSVFLWDTSLKSWEDRVCRLANRNFTLLEWEQYFPGEPYRQTCRSLPVPLDIIDAALQQAEALVTSDPQTASRLFTQATQWAIETNDLEINNKICWAGCIDGFATIVLPAGQRAVELSPGSPEIRDTRGLARALTGNYQGAIEDFTFYVLQTQNKENRIQRQSWIGELMAGRNPFDKTTLEAIRDQ